MSVDTSYHERFLAEQLDDPDFRAEYDRAALEIAIVDRVIRTLDEVRAQTKLSKAQLARQVGMDPASIRRLFSSDANPTMRTVAALAAALDMEITIAPRVRTVAQPAPRSRPRRLASA